MPEWLIKIFDKPEKLIKNLFIFTLIYLLILLFIPNFNLLKILIAGGIILVSFNFVIFLRFLKLPKEEKISVFNIFQSILDNFNEGIVIYDDDLKMIFVNKVFCELTGLEKENLINLRVNQGMIKNEKYEILANIFFPFLQGEDLEVVSKEPEVIKAKFSYPKEKYFLITYFDIFVDKKYKLRVVLDRTEDVLEPQKRMEFTQIVSHNLLTPFNQIRWLLEAIDLKKIDEDQKEYITNALEIVKTTLPFVESILAFVRTESGRLELKIEEIDLEKIFINILDILKTKIKEKGIKVNVEIVKNEEKAIGDKGLIFSALYSIVENAVFYNKTGGKIDIIIRKLEQRPYREIIIKDTGIGISKEDLDNLFKKYYRGRKAKDLEVKGFGIGLYNAKRILNLHGGEIKVESEENKGTTVYVILPLDVNLIP